MSVQPREAGAAEAPDPARSLRAIRAALVVRQDREAFDAGHRGDGLAVAATLDDEYGIDEIVDAQVVFAHQPPRKIIPPHAPHAGRRK